MPYQIPKSAESCASAATEASEGRGEGEPEGSGRWARSAPGPRVSAEQRERGTAGTGGTDAVGGLGSDVAVETTVVTGGFDEEELEEDGGGLASDWVGVLAPAESAE